MGCGEGVAKILLFITNLCFVLVGIALFSLGIVGRINLDKVSEGVPEKVISSGLFNFLIAIGVIIFFIAFLGCCGSCKKNTFMINSYGAILILLFLGQVALGIYALIQIKDTEDLKSLVEKQVKSLVAKYKTDESAQATMDSIQQGLKCCGATSAADYLVYLTAPPTSCYPTKSIIPYTDGCATLISDLLVTYTKLLAIIVLSVSSVEVTGAVLAFGLAYCINDRRKAY